MSAGILWRPVKGGVRLSVCTPSAFIKALGIPATFTDKDIKFLLGVKAAREDWEEAIDDIIDAINKHGEIEIYAEY